jgi:hypothetical protein
MCHLQRENIKVFLVVLKLVEKSKKTGNKETNLTK